MDNAEMITSDGDDTSGTTPIIVASPGSPSKFMFFDYRGYRLTKNFIDYKPSTITCVTLLTGENKDLVALQHVLPVVGPYRRSTAKPGEITSYRWMGCIRGDAGGFFKNSPILNVMIDTKQTPISIKLSRGKIQMCGCKDMSMAKQVSDIMVTQINNAVSFISSIRDNKELYVLSARWLLSHCTNYPPIEGQATPIVWPLESSVPEEYKHFVTQIMLRCDDVNEYSLLNSKATYFYSLADISIADETCTARLGKSMVNYNYNLGYHIDRDSMNRCLISLGIACDYFNQKPSSVTIEMTSEIENDEDVIKKIPETYSKQTFRIQTKGCIMHSGPGGAAMEDCYYKFCCLMEQIRPYVEKKA